MSPMQHLKSVLLLAIVSLAVAVPTAAQEPPAAQPGTSSGLRVFLDCRRCDFDHFRREVVFVDYMRDRVGSQVHVLVTNQSTSAGGQEYTFYFIGQDEFAGRQDTLSFTSTQDMTDDDVRSGMTRTFQLGLIPFAARTPLGQSLELLYSGQRESEAVGGEQQNDPWNLWVFRVRLGGSAEGQSRENQVSMNGSLSANRTTESFKLDINTNGRYDEDHFELSNGEKLTSVTRNTSAQLTAVWSLSDHWSAGFRGNVSSSTRSNHNLAVRGSPAIEYSVYPYAESTRRQITAMYTLGPVYFDYAEKTVFLQTEEFRWEEILDISSSFRQPWGNMNFSVEGRNYMHDFALHRLEVSGGFDIRLFRGFSLDIRGSLARIKNQLNVELGDIPDEEILLRRTELGTDFEYDFNIGINYTFGSAFNNVVNPRMWRGGGGPGGGFDRGN